MGLIPLLFKQNKVTKWLNHRNLYLLGLSTLACGLGWSNLLMSLGQFIILGNWIIEFGFKKKLELLKSTKILWLLLSFYILHLSGLLWSEDFSYASKDLRIKLPLFILPLIIGTTSKLKSSELVLLVRIYIVTLILLSLTSLGKYLSLWGEPILDKRQLSIYISHIRYGLNFSIGIVFLIFLKPFKKTAVDYSISFWFFTCLIIFQLYSGLIFLLIIAVLYFFIHVIKQVKLTYLKKIILISIVGSIALICFQFFSIYKDFNTIPFIEFDQNNVQNSFSPNGEPYWSDLNDVRAENGIYVRRFIAWKEIEKAWNKRSSMEFWSSDLKGQTLDQTLNRYLSSKGLKKDSTTISQLTNREIKAIEKGIANTYYLNHNSLQNRIHKTFFELSEYQKTGIANGFSLALRIEYWNTSLFIIKNHFFIGVGTGDIKNAFKNKYEELNSQLDKIYRNRAHNQYLTIMVTFGILGLVIFMAYLLIPIFYESPYKIIYLLIYSILILSFFTEDTLETQAGVTLFAFFNSLFLLGLKNNQNEE